MEAIDPRSNHKSIDNQEESRYAVVAPAPVPVPQPVKPVEPLSPKRYKIQFTSDAALREKLERLQALTGAKDLADVIDQAVTERLGRLEARRYGQTDKPRQTLEEANTSPNSRHIPAAVRRTVWERDRGRCTFVVEDGRRCKEQNQLEFHHQRPFARGGDHSVDNVALLCRAHNGYLAEIDYGQEKMAKYRGSRDRVSEPPPGYRRESRATWNAAALAILGVRVWTSVFK